jgi:hypothetical protein
MTADKNPAAARKRRKEIMQNLRAESAKKDDTSATTGAAAAALAEEQALPPPKKRKVSSKKAKAVAVAPPKEPPTLTVEATTTTTTVGVVAKRTTVTKVVEGDQKKTQIRYDPDVPMNKDQLAAWRREARRVRNRESAAASRQRIRDRITELEAEVDEWKARYAQAVDRLEHLQHIANDEEPSNAE